MVKTRIIPTLLYKDHGLVKGQSFDSSRRIGTALPAIRVYSRREVDEIVFLDISATAKRTVVNPAVVDELADHCHMPLTVGGGITVLDDVRALLAAGADKVCINSAAVERPGLIRAAADRFGSQSIVVSIDYRSDRMGLPEVVIRSGTTPTGIKVTTWVRAIVAEGAGEILLTCIERDGTMKGYDISTVREVAESVDVPVIVSGGAGSYEDMYQGLVTGGATAVAASSMFQFTQQTPLGAKRYLQDRGIAVRL